MISRRLRALALAVPVALVVAACGDSPSESEGPLLFWTIEDVADRVEAQKRLLADFTSKTGIQTELVAVAEDQLTTVLTSAAAANDLPDVIGAISLPIMSQLHTDQLLDTETAKSIVDTLGPDTFTEQALRLTRDGDTQLAVPSDGWAQLLYYRKDLFAQAGLADPTTYEAITQAAEQLGQGDMAGIVAATAPGDAFTHQTFEHIALANGCQLVGDNDQLALDSPACVEAFRFFSDLIRNHSVQGNQDVDTTRATYFSGKAAMVVWSSFLLDELAGLRNDTMPTCPECRGDATFLAKNTGVVSALAGPGSSTPSTFGEIVSFGVLRDADTERAKALVEYLMGEGYQGWLAVGPEGKVPVRPGNGSDPQGNLKMWRTLEAGVDTKAPLSQFYDTRALEAVEGSPSSFSRWGYAQGQGELAGAVTGQLVLPKAFSDLVNGSGDAQAAARKAQEEASRIKDELGS
jgi:multiple sugar transport system substrate-binding protein